MELIPLFSGSSGNSILVRACGKNLLFDLGQSCKRIDEALGSVGTDPDHIDGIFITHLHSDHVSGVDVFVRKHRAPIFATLSTHRYIAKICKKEHDSNLDIVVNENDVIDFDENIKIFTCSTPHDVQGSVCFKVEAEGKACVIMTDLGHVTEQIRGMAEGANGVLIESNYDLDMLKNGPYDYMLKKRVGGPDGHLSNTDCAEMIRHLLENGTHQFILGHLSENNNLPELAFNTVKHYLSQNYYTLDEDYSLWVANRYEPSRGLVL